MSAQPAKDDDQFVTIGVDAQDMHRYAELTLENGEVLIYDRENENAWFQSESAIQLEMMA